MYHPEVNLTKPWTIVNESELSKLRGHTRDTKKNTGPPQPAGGPVSVFEHLQHRAHLLPSVHCLVLKH